MGIFLVTPIDHPELAISAVKFILRDDAFSIPGSNSLIVSYPGTAEELSARLGFTTGENGMTGIVVGISEYSGKVPADIEDWIKAKKALD
jgi:hypothetical protein